MVTLALMNQTHHLIHVHIVDLAESTIKDNARFFEGNLDLVPKSNYDGY